MAKLIFKKTLSRHIGITAYQNLPLFIGHHTKQFIRLICLMLFTVTNSIYAQTDSTFCGRFYNEEYKTFIVLDVDSQHVTVPGQEFMGEMAGYLGQKFDSRVWFFTSAVRERKNSVRLEITNDYGSEDLEATLTLQPDGSLKLKQQSGSRLKIVVDHKWQKLPTELVFKREKSKVKH